VTDSPSAGIDEDAEKILNDAIGRELRDARERKGWSRRAMAGLLGPSPRTLMKYELGEWPVPFLRLVDLCIRLDLEPIALMRRVLQRAGIAPDKVTLEVDLLALLRDEFDPLFLHPWAKSKLAESGREVVELSPKEVKTLSRDFHPHENVARYLAQFYPKDTTPD
jgi:transcriptional regulator with XRE-family HTH domain